MVGLERGPEFWGELLVAKETYLHDVVKTEGIEAVVGEVVNGDGGEDL